MESMCVCGPAKEEAAGLLMRKMLERGVSVVAYGNPDYYMYVYGIAPASIMSTGYEELTRDCRLPFIAKSCKASEEKLEKCFNEYGMAQKYKTMKGRENGQTFLDPSKYLSFYQIRKGKTKRECFFTEALLMNIISQCLYEDGIHEVALFIEKPFTPVTVTTLEVMSMAQRGYVSTVCIYENDQGVVLRNRVYAEGSDLMLQAPKESYKLI